METNNQRIISSLAIAVLACMAFNVHAETQQISGTTTGSYTKQQQVPITNADGHVLLMNESHGNNKNTSGISFMDGASITNQEIAQLYQGNGENAGYITFAKDEDTTVAQWSGHVTTVMKDGNPMTTFKGKWEYVGGSGKYQSIKGKGEYNGYFTSPTESTVNWKGRYSLGN